MSFWNLLLARIFPSVATQMPSQAAIGKLLGNDQELHRGIFTSNLRWPFRNVTVATIAYKGQNWLSYNQMCTLIGGRRGGEELEESVEKAIQKLEISKLGFQQSLKISGHDIEVLDPCGVALVAQSVLKWTQFTRRWRLASYIHWCNTVKQNRTDHSPLSIASADKRTLALRTGAAFSGQDARLDFHVEKDAESAYLIFKAKEFIDTAIARVEARGRSFYILASLCFFFSIVILATGILYGWSSSVPKLEAANWPNFIITLVKVLFVPGLLLIAIKLLMALGKAFMHEAVKNFERRHAMRFGWLHIEMKGRDWNFDEMQKAFQWNREGSSAFRDIDLKQVSDTTLNLLLARLNELGSKALDKAVPSSKQSGAAGQTKE